MSCQVILLMLPKHHSPCPCGSGKKYKHCHEAVDRQNAQRLTQAMHKHQSGDLATALTLYAGILKTDPRHFDALHMTGVIHYQLNDHETALSYYAKALSLRNDISALWNNAGNACQSLKRYDDAVLLFRKAIERDPNNAMAWGNLGNALNYKEQQTEALVAWKQAVALDPTFTPPLVQTIMTSALRCDWQDLHSYERLLLSLEPTRVHATPPFPVLTIHSEPAQQLKWAASFAHPLTLRAASVRQSLQRPAHRNPQRLTIGYLSNDFHNHATAYLMSEILELHDRDTFRIHAYAFDEDDGSNVRRRLVAACDSFVDLAGMNDMEAAQQIINDGVDILVDLKGYTTGARVEIAALRPAPIQVNWLGYPGTMGADFIDYIIADAFVIPEDQAHHYSEQVVRLPDCYQPNDRKRAIDPHTPTRAECGLPDTGFIFCCFNQSYKITPEMFDVWMYLLAKTPGAVLWLLEWNQWATDNLRREAAARGIDPSRLVFAPKLPPAQHLARYRIADLFIDTFPVGAHTTASDALWAGLPVLALVGESFISRVAGSLLHATGLSELVTYSLKEYEALALALANNPSQVSALRQRLAQNRDRCPLFDTPRFVRHLETGFRKMWERRAAGQPPATFNVACQDN